MCAATGYDLLKVLLGKHSDGAVPLHLDLHGWTVLAIGFAVSFIVAYASVAALMAWVRNRGFMPFAVYRIGVGIAVLAWAASKNP
jgi:undecaprenyl-diphosphatase